MYPAVIQLILLAKLAKHPLACLQATFALVTSLPLFSILFELQDIHFTVAFTYLFKFIFRRRRRNSEDVVQFSIHNARHDANRQLQRDLLRRRFSCVTIRGSTGWDCPDFCQKQHRQTPHDKKMLKHGTYLLFQNKYIFV